MELTELKDGLWRWTAPHPAWQEEADWPEEVGCVCYRTPEAFVLVDPLVPGEEEPSLRSLDRRVDDANLPVTVVLTAPWHRRSASDVAARYGARIVDQELCPGADALPVPPVCEEQVALFLPTYGALVTAEILADLGGGLAVHPSPALRDEGALAPFLRRLLELPVEQILPAHGPPVLESAREALAQLVAPSAA